VLIEEVELDPHVAAWFTGRGGDAPADTAGAPALGAAGNLSHARPHRPDDLAAARHVVGARTRTDPATWHHMRQVHGREVGRIGATTSIGAELRGVDALVTAEVDRPLVVQVADCVPVLLAGPVTAGVVHAGRRGVVAGIVAATLAALGDLGDRAGDLSAVVGPAIGGCCYEVPAGLQAEVVTAVPGAGATTTWGAPALDLPGAVVAQLAAGGVARVTRAGGCTRCDPEQRWFSHRADPGTGRQIGLLVRRAARATPPAAGAW
jgi:polyphenol oxidase